MPRKGDIRRHERVPQAVPVQVGWKDRLGNEKFANAEILDVSEAGMRVKVPESLAEHTFVTLRSDRLALHGRASVRSCVRRGAKYLVGLEFIGGLQWKPRLEK
jgi:PilZ domain